MEEVKAEIAKIIYDALGNEQVSLEEIESKIEKPKDKKNGDFAYPCFNLSKVLRNSPINIANDLQSKIILNNSLSKVEALNGF